MPCPAGPTPPLLHRMRGRGPGQGPLLVLLSLGVVSARGLGHKEHAEGARPICTPTPGSAVSPTGAHRLLWPPPHSLFFLTQFPSPTGWLVFKVRVESAQALLRGRSPAGLPRARRCPRHQATGRLAPREVPRDAASLGH